MSMINDYLKLIVDRHINPCFYYNEDQEKSKVIYFYRVYKIYKFIGFNN